MRLNAPDQLSIKPIKFMVKNLSLQYSILCNWISELRSLEVQNDRMRFRRNLERIGEVAGFEISRSLEYEVREIQTPLGIASMKMLKEQPVLATILSGGIFAQLIPLNQLRLLALMLLQNFLPLSECLMLLLLN